MNITFGTLKTVQRGPYQKHENKAVVTIEGNKGHGKARRVLFNRSCEEMLGLVEGNEGQSLVLGFEQETNTLLMANTTSIPGSEEGLTYNLSKNRVQYDNSKEKGKSVSSARMHEEMTGFLGIHEDETHEYELIEFENEQGMKLFQLADLNRIIVEEIEVVAEEVAAEETVSLEEASDDSFGFEVKEAIV